MAEFIDRDAVKLALAREFAYHAYAGEAACAVVDKISAADVVERKTGKWIPIKEETGVEAFGFKEKAVVAFGCSVCEKEVDVSEGDFNFCPHCGAKMIGGDDDGA